MAVGYYNRGGCSTAGGGIINSYVADLGATPAIIGIESGHGVIFKRMIGRSSV